MNLLEQYKDRIRVAEGFYSKSHAGEKMDSRKQLLVAQCLKNTSAFLKEAFDASTGTQRSAMGDYRRFCLNMLTVALPSLISTDIVMTQPMTSITGYVPYMKYSAGVTKGDTTLGDVYNTPFALGDVDSTYTSSRVVESFTGDNTTTAFDLAWDAAILDGGALAGGKITVDGTETTAYTAATVNGVTTVTFTAAPATSAKIRIAYVYDNEVVPQKKLPTIKAEVDYIQLLAKPRRIAIFYSQLAAFQSKQDYGVDLSANLVEQACGRLAYEIDTEVTDLLIENAASDNDLNWSKTLPVGVNKVDHYMGFLEVIEIAKQKIYDVTKKFVPNYMLVASNLMPVISMIGSFKPADYGNNVNGPYFAGTLGTMKVFVTPNIEAGSYVFGVNGSDLMSSAAIYAPYMPVVPTQLLEMADGGSTQGFATMYDLKILNANLLVKGHLV